MNFYATICRKIKIWWKTPCYYSIVNGMPPIYETEEELQELIEELKEQSNNRKINNMSNPQTKKSVMSP